MKIGILGLSFQVGNKGCEALSYSFLEVLDKIAKKNNDKYDVYLITKLPIRKLIKNYGNTDKAMADACPIVEFDNIQFGYIFYKNIKEKNLFLGNIKKCDIVFDFTAGDSFTDIYGEERFYTRTCLKQDIINKRIPLVLGSQTIGPFNDDEVRKFAIKVINECFEVFVRDKKSYEYTMEISGREPILTTDIAFELPYTKSKNESEKFRIGFNASGLLWSGGYTKNNQFKLEVDYKKYCFAVIGKMLKNPNNEIHIISHATSNNMSFLDNDMIAAKEIKEKYPQVVLVNTFDTAMDAKSYIGNMDIFIGARMHATIGALSAGVPVIAFSYSRKFEGLYESINYPYVLSARETTTEEAVKKTIEWYNNIENMKKYVKGSLEIVEEKNLFLEKKIEETIYSHTKVKNQSDS